MSEEIFDVVNERDEVIGQAPRREVHRRGLRHRAVHVLIFNARGELFLQKRSPNKDREPGVWDSSSSGHLNSGEDYDAAARREMREELGWAPRTPPRRLYKLDASPATDHEFVWVYQVAGEGPFTLDPDEIECGGWYAPANLSHWMEDRPEDFAASFRTIWQRVAPGRADAGPG